MTTILPVPELHPRSLGSRNPTSPWIHDTCEECGFDGDVAVVRDLDEGLVGWECPDCYTFVTMRDLRDE